MKNSKKIVSILLAVILTVSSIACVASFSASAADSKLSVTASSNFFPERTETFNADTDTLTVSFYIKSDQMMLNSQWNLYFDPEVLAYDDTDGVNQTGIYYEGELLGYELNISPVAIEDGYIINTGKVDIGEIHGNNSNAYPVYELKREDNSKIGFVTVTFKVLNPNADTTVHLELVELLTNKGQIYKFSSQEADGSLMTFETQSSIYSGTYDPDYENKDEPEPQYLIGDLNDDGFINVSDAVIVQKWTSGRITLDERQTYVGDVNDDGTVDILDAAEIQKYAAEEISEFKKKA